MVAAPMLAFVLLVYAVRPVGPTVAPMRLAVICAALAVAAVAVLAVEVASAFGALTRPVIGSVWLAVLAAAGALAWWRFRRGGGPAGAESARVGG